MWQKNVKLKVIFQKNSLVINERIRWSTSRYYLGSDWSDETPPQNDNGANRCWWKSMSLLSIKAVKPSSAEVRPNLIWHFKWNIFSPSLISVKRYPRDPTQTRPKGMKRSCKMKAVTWKRWKEGKWEIEGDGRGERKVLLLTYPCGKERESGGRKESKNKVENV